jgi:hypothetical protein
LNFPGTLSLMHDMSDRRVPREIWVLLALCVLAHFPILRNEFVNFDDIEFIRDNRDFNPPHLAALVHYWRGPYFGGAFRSRTRSSVRWRRWRGTARSSSRSRFAWPGCCCTPGAS